VRRSKTKSLIACAAAAGLNLILLTGAAPAAVALAAQ
jgi:hypothetical protein